MDGFRTFIKDYWIQDTCTVELDVPYIWNFTYLMLEIDLKFQRAIKRLEEQDIDFAMLVGGIPKSED